MEVKCEIGEIVSCVKQNLTSRAMIFYVQIVFRRQESVNTWDVKTFYVSYQWRPSSIRGLIPYCTVQKINKNRRILLCRGVNTLLLYSTENKIKIQDTTYCRGVLSGAAMAPPALHLRENTRSRRQGRRHDPLGGTIGGLDQQRANGSHYNADPHLQLYSCRIASCSIRSQVVCETEAQPRQTNTTPVQ